MMGGGSMMMGGAGFGMLVWWIIAVVVLSLLGYWIFQYSHRRSATYGESHATDILRERYARGEIDETTYQRMKDALK